MRVYIATMALAGALLGAAACDSATDERLADQPKPDSELIGLPVVPDNVMAACDDFCTAVGDDCNPRCYRGCVESYDYYDSCHDQQLAYLSCVSDNFVNCHTVPAQCSAAEYELGACKGCSRGGLGELNTAQKCSCFGEGAGAALEVSCEPNEIGELECTCVVDGMELLTCIEQDPANACRAVGGCCGGAL